MNVKAAETETSSVSSHLAGGTEVSILAFPNEPAPPFIQGELCTST